MTPTSRRIELQTGLGYHVLEWNPQAEHTLVLVHGFLDSSWGWEAVARAGLAEDFHLIAPDMRGHGDSDRIGRGGYYHFLDYVADLHSLVDALAHETVSLVGHSMGGTICGYFAGAFPEKLSRLALLEGMGPPENSTPVPDRVRHWVSGWFGARQRQPRTYPSIEDAAERLLRRDKRLDPAMAHFLAERGTTAAGDGLRFKHDPVHLSMGPYPFSVEIAQQFWRNIQCPVLLVQGAESSVVYSQEETGRREGCIARREKTVLADAGHMMQRHQPEALSEVLREFFRRTSAS
jgi:pimeloyl-ACP methyl ester carboxylesterase